MNTLVYGEPALCFILDRDIESSTKRDLFDLITSNPHFSVDLSDDYQNTPLHIAVGEGNPYYVKKLIELGSNTNKTNGEGRTPIFSSFPTRDDNEVFLLLVENGADLNVQDEEGNTALHVLVNDAGEDIDGILYFIDKGARVDIINDEGFTVLDLVSKSVRDQIDQRIRYNLWVDQENQNELYDNMFQWLPTEQLYFPTKK